MNDGSLPGKPDIVFAGQRVLVFCDGDFWHGRNLRARLARLKRGHNSEYWLAKIKANVARDITRTRALEAGGWTVLRFWESDISASPKGVADAVERILKSRKRT